MIRKKNREIECCSNLENENKIQVIEKVGVTACCSTESVKKIQINEANCTGCGICVEVCPFGLPKARESGIFYIGNPNLCVECSACKRNCPANAVIMVEQEGCGCLWNARQRSKGKSCC